MTDVSLARVCRSMQDMVTAAIVALHEPNGSACESILQWLEVCPLPGPAAAQSCLPTWFARHCKAASGFGSYRHGMTQTLGGLTLPVMRHAFLRPPRHARVLKQAWAQSRYGLAHPFRKQIRATLEDMLETQRLEKTPGPPALYRIGGTMGRLADSTDAATWSAFQANAPLSSNPRVSPGACGGMGQTVPALSRLCRQHISS